MPSVPDPELIPVSAPRRERLSRARRGGRRRPPLRSQVPGEEPYRPSARSAAPSRSDEMPSVCRSGGQLTNHPSALTPPLDSGALDSDVWRTSSTACAAGRRSWPTAAWARCSQARYRVCAARRRRTCARRRASWRCTRATSRAGAELIETNTFGANRRKLAATSARGRASSAINSAAVRLAREAREIAGRDVWIAGSIGPLGELEVFDPASHGAAYAEQAQVLEGRGVDLFMIETFFDLDEIVVAVEAVRGGVVAADRGAADVRRGGRADRRGRRGRSGAAAGRARCGSDRDEPRRRAARSADGDCRHAGHRHPARGTAEHRSREHGRRARRLPARDPRVLRRVRGAGGRARRAHRRRVLRHDTGADRGDPRRARRAAARRGRPFVRASPRCPHTAAGGRARRRSRALCATGEWVVCVELDPPKGGSLDGLVDVARTLRDSGARRLRGRQRQPDGPRAHERSHGLGRDPARDRARDDPARDPA